MGYYNYQRGLIYHHLDQEGGWESHLQNCRDFITETTARLKPLRVTVLGSGWLLDFPVREIAGMVDEVCLVDIVHPPEVMEQVSRLANVKLIEDDVTGGFIRNVWEKCAGKKYFNRLRSLDELSVPEYQPVEKQGMVVSLNLLTQLETLPLAFIRKRAKAGEDEYYRLRSELQKQHISFLKKHDSVLITDLSEIITSKSGETREEPSVIIDLPRGRYSEEWTWSFEQKRSDYYTRKSDFRIRALLL